LHIQIEVTAAEVKSESVRLNAAEQQQFSMKEYISGTEQQMITLRAWIADLTERSRPTSASADGMSVFMCGAIR